MSAPYALPRTRIFGYWCILPIKLLRPTNLVKIVDSIMALFRVDYSGRGELSERQQKVSYLLPLRGSMNSSVIL